jgi:ATP-binding cassette subfamily B protein
MPSYLRFALPAWVCLLAEALIDLSLPTLLASIVNQGVMVRDMDHVVRVGTLMLALALFGALAGLSRNWLSTHASQNLGTQIRGDLFRKTQAMSLATTRQIGTASLITRLTNDVMQIQNLSFMLTRIFIRAPLLLIGGIFMAVMLNPQMAVILVFILPLLALLIFIRVKRGFPLFRKVQVAIDRVNGVLREFLGGVRVVKVFNRMDYEGERFDGANQNLSNLSITAARSMATIQPLIFILMNGSIIALLWLGGVRVNSGDAQVGDIMAFINYFLQILHAMTMMSMIFTAGVRAKTSIDRIGQALTSPEDMAEPAEPKQPEQTGAIAMDLVSYTFPGQVQPVLRNVSFAIEPGQTAAIIGSTGCGKTTLINLLGRFFDADSGSVKIDGTDVRDMSFADLRRRIAYVPQESVLFTGSIDDNLRWGFPEAGADDISRAVEIAQAAEFIDQMPEGLETRIGQGGVNVSGGQKQRLCIARALIRRAPILIMDDSTSAIDMGTEQKLRQALKKHCQGMTVIMIAQRVQSVMDADVIFVMNGGGIESAGTHRELLQTSTIYRDIFRSQIGLDLDGQEVI